MEERKLGEIIRFTLGKNPTRSKVSASDRYTLEDLEADLYSTDTSISGICMINLINSKAAPLSERNADKFWTSNFLRCEFDDSVLDTWYFCYGFNAGQMLQRQISRNTQGTTLSVQKLNRKIISELQIRLPEIDKQKMIGKLYRRSLVQHDLMLKQAENMNQMTLAIIGKIEDDDEYGRK